MQQLKDRKSLLILLVCFVWLSGCDSSTDPDLDVPFFLTDYGSTSGTFKDLLTSEESKDLVGMIHLEWSKYNTLEHLTSQTELSLFTGNESSGEARFSDDNGRPNDIAEVRINACDFNKSGEGQITLADPPIHFDSTKQNQLRVDLGDGQGVVVDSFLIGPKTVVTNLTPGQQLSPTDSIRIEWSGVNTNPVSIMIMKRDPARSIVRRVPNSGATSIMLFPGQLSTGLADVYVTQYEKRFITLPSGKKLFVLIERQNIVSVNFVD